MTTNKHFHNELPRFLESFKQPVKSLLDTIHTFTLDIDASVSIYEAEYIVYYKDSCRAYRTKTDEDLLKIMAAIRVLDGFQED